MNVQYWKYFFSQLITDLIIATPRGNRLFQVNLTVHNILIYKKLSHHQLRTKVLGVLVSPSVPIKVYTQQPDHFAVPQQAHYSLNYFGSLYYLIET
ncbi:Uncharacterised protein [Legionella pneumophila]|nr:Uncharacterised protein [Legionella pneumophila]